MPRYTSAVVAIAATLWILIQARAVLEPFMIALFVWFLLNAIAATWTRYVHGPDAKPTFLARAISGTLFICTLIMLTLLVAKNAERLRGQIPVYEANLDAMISKFTSAVGIESYFSVGELIAKIDLTSIALQLAGTAANLVSMLIIIIVYIIFISMESDAAENKLAAMVSSPDRRDEITKITRRINHDIETYLGIKIILGIVQAVPTYIVLSLVEVDAAAFWAIVIFFFSFIPTIGSLVGIIFPSLMALVQFDTIVPFFTVLGTLAAVQLLASNYLEPRLMGKSLNLSPLAIFLAIFAGGALWGIVGAIIIVPLLAVAMIVFSQIPSMRPVAIMLSGDGEVGPERSSDNSKEETA